MGNNTGTEAKKVVNYDFIDARCIVKFRPADNWEGEYGFDWFREGDYGEVFNTNTRGSAFLHTYRDNDGNNVVDPSGRPLQIEIKSKSNYKERIRSDQKELVGIYGEQISYFSSNLSVQRAYKNYIYLSNKFLKLNNQFRHFEKKDNGKWLCKFQNGEIYSFRGTDVEFDYDEATKRMSSDTTGEVFQLLEKYYNDFAEGEFCGVDPDRQIYSFSDNQRNDLGKTINADLYAEKNYSPIKIYAWHHNRSTYVLTNHQYYVPSINLFYIKVNNTATTNASNSWEYKAKVKLLIHAENIRSIDFVAEEGTKGILLDHRSIGDIRNGDSEDKELTIYLTRDFAKNTKDVSIWAIATHKTGGLSTLAGKINILKHNPKYIDVLIVPIFVDSNVPSNLDNMLKEEKKHLEKFFSQAQIVPLVDTGKRINNANSQRKIAILIDASSKYKRDRLGNPIREYLTTKTIRDTTFNGQVIPAGTSLHVEFEKLFVGEPYDDNTKNAYKVFYILYEGDCAGETAGFPNDTPKPPKNVIVFEDHWDETPIHELLHRLGLYHSFSNFSSYTFKKYSTSNIMDYAKSQGLKRQSSWRWQWDEIRKQIDKDKQQNQNYNLT